MHQVVDEYKARVLNIKLKDAQLEYWVCNVKKYFAVYFMQSKVLG